MIDLVLFGIVMVPLSLLDLLATYWIVLEAKKQGIPRAEEGEQNPILPVFWKAWGIKKGTLYFVPISLSITFIVLFLITLVPAKTAFFLAGVWVGCDIMVFHMHIHNIQLLLERRKTHANICPSNS